MTSADQKKKSAAQAALKLVFPGMRLGLGTGSTASAFVTLLGEKVREGLDIIAVPTSEGTRRLAEARGIRLTTLDETPTLDLCVDGADEVDPVLNLIKGGGGALLREKIVAQASARMVVIVDDTKLSDNLGGFPLPVEVVPFGARATVMSIDEATRRHGIGGAIVRREIGGAPFVTDNNMHIYDCHYRNIPDPALLAADIASIAGVAEHGLFAGIASTVVVGTDDGVEIMGQPI